MLRQVLQFVSGTLMVIAAAILAGISNPAWPLVGAAGLLFWLASVRSYRSVTRKLNAAKGEAIE